MNLGRDSCPSREERGPLHNRLLILAANPVDRVSQDIYASIKFGDRDKFAGAMGDANVAGTEDHGLSAKFRQLRRLGAKSYRARLVSGESFQECDECRLGRSFEAFVGSGRGG